MVKIGSRVLTKKDGFLNVEVISNLVKDVAELMKKDMDVILVTSGAVSTGRYIKSLKDMKVVGAEAIKYDKEIIREQVLAAVGQPRLMAVYINEFDKYDLHCAQLLATRSVFADRSSYLSMRTVTNNLLNAGIVPIFNENDALSPEEYDFTDNDQLACMIASMIGADKVFLLTDTAGLYDRSPKDPKAKIIHQVDKIGEAFKLVDESSGSGKGGMRSKLLSADLVTSLGISLYIASGLEKSIVSRIIDGEKIGTFFPAKNNKLKPIKNWLATAAVGEGKIVVSTFLADILRMKKTASVLFSGIEEVQGNFKKKEAVEICDDSGCILARGIARFDGKEMKEKISEFRKKSSKDKARMKTSQIIAVHYDYLVFV